MPQTSGLNQGNLPFVVKETNELNNLLSSRIQTTVVLKPTRENVLSILHDHQIVHFLYHSSSPVNPSQSQLVLHDWKISPLTVSDLMAMKIQLPQFAVLSTCHSASSRYFRVLSESINLSSAIQLCRLPVSRRYSMECLPILTSSICTSFAFVRGLSSIMPVNLR